MKTNLIFIRGNKIFSARAYDNEDPTEQELRSSERHCIANIPLEDLDNYYYDPEDELLKEKKKIEIVADHEIIIRNQVATIHYDSTEKLELFISLSDGVEHHTRTVYPFEYEKAGEFQIKSEILGKIYVSVNDDRYYSTPTIIKVVEEREEDE